MVNQTAVPVMVTAVKVGGVTFTVSGVAFTVSDETYGHCHMCTYVSFITDCKKFRHQLKVMPPTVSFFTVKVNCNPVNRHKGGLLVGCD